MLQSAPSALQQFPMLPSMVHQMVELLCDDPEKNSSLSLEQAVAEMGPMSGLKDLFGYDDGDDF